MILSVAAETVYCIVIVPERHYADVTNRCRCTHAVDEGLDHSSVVELGLLVITMNRRGRIVLLSLVVFPLDLLFDLPDGQLVLRADVII